MVRQHVFSNSKSIFSSYLYSWTTSGTSWSDMVNIPCEFTSSIISTVWLPTEVKKQNQRSRFRELQTIPIAFWRNNRVWFCGGWLLYAVDLSTLPARQCGIDNATGTAPGKRKRFEHQKLLLWHMYKYFYIYLHIFIFIYLHIYIHIYTVHIYIYVGERSQKVPLSFSKCTGNISWGFLFVRVFSGKRWRNLRSPWRWSHLLFVLQSGTAGSVWNGALCEPVQWYASWSYLLKWKDASVMLWNASGETKKQHCNCKNKKFPKKLVSSLTWFFFEK